MALLTLTAYGVSRNLLTGVEAPFLTLSNGAVTFNIHPPEEEWNRLLRHLEGQQEPSISDEPLVEGSLEVEPY